MGGLLFWGMLDMVCGRLWCEEPLLAESAVPYIRENLKHFLDSNPDACLPACPHGKFTAVQKSALSQNSLAFST